MEYKWVNYLCILLSDWYLTWSTSESIISVFCWVIDIWHGVQVSQLSLYSVEWLIFDMEYKWVNYLYILLSDWYLTWSTSESIISIFCWVIDIWHGVKVSQLSLYSVEWLIFDMEYKWVNYLYILLSDWYLTWSTSESIISIFCWVIDIWHGVQVSQLSLYSVEWLIFDMEYKWVNYLCILLSDWYLTWSTSESIIFVFCWVIDIWHGVQVSQLSLYSVEWLIFDMEYKWVNYLYILLSDWYLTWSKSESIISIFCWVIDIWHGVQVSQLSLYSVEWLIFDMEYKWVNYLYILLSDWYLTWSTSESIISVFCWVIDIWHGVQVSQLSLYSVEWFIFDMEYKWVNFLYILLSDWYLTWSTSESIISVFCWVIDIWHGVQVSQLSLYSVEWLIFDMEYKWVNYLCILLSDWYLTWSTSESIISIFCWVIDIWHGVQVSQLSLYSVEWLIFDMEYKWVNYLYILLSDWYLTWSTSETIISVFCWVIDIWHGVQVSQLSLYSVEWLIFDMEYKWVNYLCFLLSDWYLTWSTSESIISVFCWVIDIWHGVQVSQLSLYSVEWLIFDMEYKWVKQI